MTQNNIVEFGDVVRRFGEFDAMRKAVEQMDERIMGEITRLVWQSSAAAGWKCGFEADYLRWWFAPLEWRRTLDTPHCQYDFEMYFNLTRGGFPCSEVWPVVPSILGHLIGSNNSRLAIRCHVYRMRTKMFIDMLKERADILTPLTDLGWEFNVREGYLEYPIKFNIDRIAAGFEIYEIGNALEPICGAISNIVRANDTHFAPLLDEGLKRIAEIHENILGER